MKKLPESKSPQDIDCWLQEVKDVAAMPQPEERPSSPLIIEEIKPSLNLKGVYNANSFTPLAIGDTSNLDRRTAEKFVRGQFKIEARLDLHGLSEKEAFSAVVDFILQSYVRGLRCILIITGKGIKKENDTWYEPKGIIKDALPSWLNNAEIRPFILSMVNALPADGGDGAMYVLLKRQRL